jgi:hypothetical protein
MLSLINIFPFPVFFYKRDQIIFQNEIYYFENHTRHFQKQLHTVIGSGERVRDHWKRLKPHCASDLHTQALLASSQLSPEKSA